MTDYDERLAASVRAIGDGWAESPYYANVENMLAQFWREKSPFYAMFKRLDLTHVIELACGHGRHSEQIKDKAERITLMDINESNVEVCRSRFKDNHNVSAIINNGLDFFPLPDSSVSAVFCYDAMVHFDHRSVATYLQDFSRVVADGAYGLFHHSNNGNPFFTHYGQNPHSRNFMTKELFARYALDADLNVVEQEVIGWGGGDNRVADLDCISLVQKAAK